MSWRMKNPDSKNTELPSTTRSLPICLIRAREGIMSPIREMLAESGITEQQWRVLRVLAEYGAQDNSTLAHRACLLLPSLTRISQKMRDNGLVTLSKDMSDKRKQTVTITERGMRIVEDNRDEAAHIVEGFKEKLGAEQYEQLLDLLAQLNPDDQP